MPTKTEIAKSNIFYNKLVHFTQIQILLMELYMFLLIWHHKFVIILETLFYGHFNFIKIKLNRLQLSKSIRNLKKKKIKFKKTQGFV